MLENSLISFSAGRATAQFTDLVPQRGTTENARHVSRGALARCGIGLLNHCNKLDAKNENAYDSRNPAPGARQSLAHPEASVREAVGVG